MAKKRLAVPKSVEKRAFQEAGSRCCFCKEVEVTALHIHHIDGDPSNNLLENLLVTCASCHAKITSGVITQAEVQAKKNDLVKNLPASVPDKNVPLMHVTINGPNYKGDIAQNMTKIVTLRTPRTSRVAHPPGSLGADLHKKGYIDYLISKYFEFKGADKSFRIRRPFSHAVIHKNIQREFGCKTFFMPVERFEELVQFLQHHIDQTALGRNLRSEGKPRYHGFAEHFAK